MAQGLLGAAGIRRIWAGVGLQRAGMGHIVWPRAQLVNFANAVNYRVSVLILLLHQSFVATNYSPGWFDILVLAYLLRLS